MKKKPSKLFFLMLICSVVLISSATSSMGITIKRNTSEETTEMIEKSASVSFDYDFGGITSNGWDIETHLTKIGGENDGDTGSEIDWAPSGFTGIYSEIRHYEGAWCVAAAEWGPVIGTETTKGYTILKSPNFKLSDFDDGLDVNRKDFEITSATLYFDWKIGSDDFDHNENDEHVKISSIMLKEIDNGGSWNIAKEELKWTPSSLGNPSGTWADLSDNDYAASSSSFRNYLNNNLESEFEILIRVECRLIAGIMNLEKFKFWLDDVKIEGEYYYDSSPKLDVPDTVSFSSSHSGPASTTFKVRNSGDESLNWEIGDVVFLSKDKTPLGINPSLDISPQRAS